MSGRRASSRPDGPTRRHSTAGSKVPSSSSSAGMLQIEADRTPLPDFAAQRGGGERVAREPVDRQFDLEGAFAECRLDRGQFHGTARTVEQARQPQRHDHRPVRGPGHERPHLLERAAMREHEQAQVLPAPSSRSPACRRWPGCRRNACGSRCARRSGRSRAAAPPRTADACGYSSSRACRRRRAARTASSASVSTRCACAHVHVVALHELAHRGVAHVVLVEAPEHVVEDALAHGAGGERHVLHLELGEDRRSMIAKPPGSTCDAVGLAGRAGRGASTSPALSSSAAQPVHALARDAAVGPAVGCDHVADACARCPRSRPPASSARARTRCSIVCSSMRAASSACFSAHLVILPSGKVAQAVADAAHVQAFELLRLVAAADDELGGAAADVDHQALLGRGRQAVRDAEVDEARFLACRPRLRSGSPSAASARAQEVLGVLGHAQRVGADRAHRRRVDSPRRRSPKRCRHSSARCLRCFVQALVGGQARRRGAPARAANRADRSGRRRRGRPGAGRSWSRGRRRRGSDVSIAVMPARLQTAQRRARTQRIRRSGGQRSNAASPRSGRTSIGRICPRSAVVRRSQRLCGETRRRAPTSAHDLALDLLER